MGLSSSLQSATRRLQQPAPAAPLATFRILFSLMMLAGTVRFWLNGWIDDLYVKPKFYFTYMGFDWVHPLNSSGMHLVFFLMALATVLVALGLFYRIAIVTFFITFTYVELLDVTNYLNHYYFISLAAFLMIWLPAGRIFSLDVYFRPKLKLAKVPLWMVGALRLQIGMVYFFAGLAKLSPDWLIEAIPMKIWLPPKSHLPIVGSLMYQEWVAY
ncbi:MAG: HTTM domain-containing protein, partial [Bacteroidota bacterium]